MVMNFSFFFHGAKFLSMGKRQLGFVNTKLIYVLDLAGLEKKNCLEGL